MNDLQISFLSWIRIDLAHNEIIFHDMEIAGVEITDARISVEKEELKKLLKRIIKEL